ncbi:hypothetical protein EV426DRAFT_196306 [Tirmania nivea]|nr:hypothetical protein EV426DRAFT_196306 [Tirmania nivea]
MYVSEVLIVLTAMTPESLPLHTSNFSLLYSIVSGIIIDSFLLFIRFRLLLETQKLSSELLELGCALTLYLGHLGLTNIVYLADTSDLFLALFVSQELIWLRLNACCCMELV